MGWYQHFWLVVYLPPEKYESQIGSSSQLYGKIQYVWNQQPGIVSPFILAELSGFSNVRIAMNSLAIWGWSPLHSPSFQRRHGVRSRSNSHRIYQPSLLILLLIRMHYCPETSWYGLQWFASFFNSIMTMMAVIWTITFTNNQSYQKHHIFNNTMTFINQQTILLTDNHQRQKSVNNQRISWQMSRCPRLVAKCNLGSDGFPGEKWLPRADSSFTGSSRREVAITYPDRKIDR